MSFKTHLLSSTVIPLALVVGVAAVAITAGTGISAAPAHAACNPCNPCAAKNPCNPCNPCAAKACNPCNPCSPCNPCAGAGGAYSATCVVPRLKMAAANPCAAKKPCAPCAAAKACNPCNPCAAKNPCNPCAAAKACNPCAAKNPCNPCAAAKACNPCAAKNPCNPCAAAKACNPCAAKNPCDSCAAKNPCAAANPCGPCNPCNPCGATQSVELTDAEALAAYGCILKEMQAAYAKSGNKVAVSYTDWPRYSTQSYQSATHGGRYVQNYGDPAAKDYGKFDDVGTLPAGATIAKDSFMVSADGRVGVGPFFLMQKMRAGFSPEGNDWKYTMIMPDGTTFGVTGGKNSAGMKFCMECHAAAADTDHLLFMPDEYRAKL